MITWKDLKAGDAMLLRVSASQKALAEFVARLEVGEHFGIKDAEGKEYVVVPPVQRVTLVFRRRDNSQLVVFNETNRLNDVIEKGEQT